MQFDVSTVIAIVTAVVAALFAVYSQIVTRREATTIRDIQATLNVERAERLVLEKRLVEEEKATIRQDGQINLVRAGHDGLRDDLGEVKIMVKEVLREVRQQGSYSSQELRRATDPGRESR